MADPPKQDGLPQGAQYQPPKPPPKQNPVFRMMGLPRLRMPSRNWTIFLTITGSFAAAVTYDRRQKKAVQKKWCDLVAHIAQEPIAVDRMPRKLTIFLSAPPGDGIRPSREYFKEYIKPVLVAAAMDYDVIEGRKEGDVRYGTAEQIRRLRRKNGETGLQPQDQEPDTDEAISMVRDKLQVLPEPGIKGDLVIGRHTWKEYIRGLHEGWLGPLDAPLPPSEPENPSIEETLKVGNDNSEAAPIETPPEEAPKEETPKKPPFPPPAYLSADAYSSAQISPHIPSMFEPSSPMYQYHLLGFLKFPYRFYNFLNRRTLADQLGRETAAIVLAAHRPYQQNASFASTSSGDGFDTPPLSTRAPENDAAVVQISENWEQQSVLTVEEPTWHKSIRKPPKKDEERSEKIWLGDVIIDPRIGERMRKFELDPVEEERSNRIGSGVEKGLAVPVHDLRSDKVILDTSDDPDT